MDPIGIPPPSPSPYPSTTAPLAPGRPSGVTVLAILAWVGAALSILAGLGMFAVGGAVAGVGGGFVAGLGVFLLVLGVAYAVVGWGLWTRQRWAWYATLAVEALAVVLGLMSLLQGDIVSPIVSLLIAGVVVWYLLKADVQAWFGVRMKTPWRSGRTA